ncbi:MAG: hypothetical protein JSW48_01010 [Betaproteobacteria bacterium]|nr:MAG: hypothetical protein JSW48_01010 [Betaproteobacteria bacterium]
MHDVAVNNLLPGASATDTMTSRMEVMARQSGRMSDAIAQAACITRRNFLIDGILLRDLSTQ